MTDLMIGRQYRVTSISKMREPDLLMAMYKAGIVNKDNIHLYKDGVPTFNPEVLVDGDIVTVDNIEEDGTVALLVKKNNEFQYYNNDLQGKAEFEPVNNHLKEVKDV